MKRFIVFLLFLSLLALACNISATPAPTVVNAPPPDTAVPSDTAVPPTSAPPTEPPTATQPPAPVTNVTCGALKLYLDPALASGYDCKTIDAVPDGPGVSPQLTELTLQGYPLSDRFFVPHIDLIPVQPYIQLAPTVIPSRVTDLMGLTAGGPVGKFLPVLPVFNAAQQFHAQYMVLPFGSGKGIRFLTEYAQFYDPANNHDMFYTYQGLTQDGAWWVSAVLPISTAILPENGDNPPNGQSWDDFGNNYDTYIADITGQLNAQSGADYSPTIQMLDALSASILVQP